MNGWQWPPSTRKAHFFREGRSLCRKWAFFGESSGITQEMGDEPGPDDCRECWRQAEKAQSGPEGA